MLCSQLALVNPFIGSGGFGYGYGSLSPAAQVFIFSVLNQNETKLMKINIGTLRGAKVGTGHYTNNRRCILASFFWLQL